MGRLSSSSIAGVLAALLAQVEPGVALRNPRIEQAVVRTNAVYEVQASVRIGFDLAKPADVTIRIARHLAIAEQHQAQYLAEPIPVRELPLGRLDVGAHEITWDGLDAQGKPITEPRHAAVDWHPDPSRLAPALTNIPVDLLRIVIATGKEEWSCNYRMRTGLLDPSRPVLTFMGAVRDGKGNLLVADRRNWRGRRLSPTWSVEETFPKYSQGHSSDPVECFDVAADSHGNVYAVTIVGLYKYGPDGLPAAWEADAEHLKFPYPSEVKNVLGVRLDAGAKEPKEYVFGPGGSGAGRKTYGPEQIDVPGFAYRWAAAAIDAADNVYFARSGPTAEIQVFDRTGAFQRKFPCPDGRVVFALRFGTDGTLWAIDGSRLLGLRADSGAVVKVVSPAPGGWLHIGPNGTIYVWGRSALGRFAATGAPLPFTAKAPYIHEDGAELDLAPSANGVPACTPGFTRGITGVAGDVDGSFHLSAPPDGNIASTSERLLHFAADGTWMPDLVSAEIVLHQPGNVFLDSAPARLDLHVNNLSTRTNAAILAWTLTDFDAHVSCGTIPVTLRPSARQIVPVTVPADQPGHYTLRLVLRCGQDAVADLTTTLARIPSRKPALEPDSPFAMCWGTDFHLMSLAGVCWERVGAAYWAKFETQPGVPLPDPPGAVQWSQSLEGYRRYAARWSVLTPECFTYGENWLGGSFPNCRIFSYDRFYGFALRVVDQFRGRVPYYQFWNEPNFFWHVPGPFGHEHFALVQQHCWSMVKARDKEALCIADGDAGGLGIMEEFARCGANRFSDAVQIHYPGAQPLRFDDIVVPDQPEGKLPMIRKLVELRDRDYPGKPVWNTEEGWWGAKMKTPEIGAVMAPRIYLSQIAAGVDRVYWFCQTGESDCLLYGPESLPYATYCSYATMTRLLEGAEYMGPADLGRQTCAHLFSRGRDVILAAWSIGGEKDVSITAGSGEATITDLMGRERRMKTVGGQFTLALSERTQYVTFPRNAWAAGVAKAELDRQLAGMQLTNVAAIGAAIATCAPAAATNDAAMTRLHVLVRAARQAALAGMAPHNGATDARAEPAREFVLAREGQDGYLRQARVALAWAEQLARAAARQGSPVGPGLAWASRRAGEAARLLAATEAPVYPGVVIDAFIGEPGEVARIRGIVSEPGDLNTAIDEKFRFEIARKPGETFDLELTVWNYYRHKTEGVLKPRLPAGWMATPELLAFAVEPGQFQRFTLTASVPADAAAGVYAIGGQTTYDDALVTEIHASRIRVER